VYFYAPYHAQQNAEGRGVRASVTDPILHVITDLCLSFLRRRIVFMPLAAQTGIPVKLIVFSFVHYYYYYYYYYHYYYYNNIIIILLTA
jgi:hypothetical protein